MTRRRRRPSRRSARRPGSRRHDRRRLPPRPRRPHRRPQSFRRRRQRPAGRRAAAPRRPVHRLLRRRHLCRGGVRRARPHRRLYLLGPPVLGLSRPDGVEPVLELRPRRGAAVPAHGRDPAARRPLRPALQGAQRLARPASRRPAPHQHRGVGRVLGDLGLLGRDGRDDGVGGAALLQGHALRSEDGARLARGRRRARQSRPARHYLHRLRADDRDLGRRPLHRRRRPEHPRDGAVRARDPRQVGLGGADRPHPAAAAAGREAAQPRRPRPDAILILVVLGTIYGGLATATESAALGVVGAMIFAAIEGKLSFRMLNTSAEATARNTALIGLILFGAYVLNYVLVGLGVPQALAKTVAAMPLPPWGIMMLIIGFYLALGTFMEGFSMIVTTIPVVFPIVTALGYDPIWFGVIVTMLVEIALISPPDGTVLYVLQGMRRDGGPITDV